LTPVLTPDTLTVSKVDARQTAIPPGVVSTPNRLKRGANVTNSSKDFPLTYRKSDGRYQKKIRGVVHYFTGSQQEALDEWLRVKDDLLAGRAAPPRPEAGGVTVAELCDRFLQRQDEKLAAGELAVLTRNDYRRVCDKLVSFFGGQRLADGLTAADFGKLRADFAGRLGPVGIGNQIVRCKVVFTWGRKERLLDRDPDYGQAFDKPSRKTLRLAKAAKPAKLFTAAEVQAMLKAADPQLKAMTLLAVFAGFGNSDCARLELRHLDLEGGWVTFPRPKTGVERKAKLPTECVAAIREALAVRPESKDPQAAKLVFVNSAGGSFAGSDGSNNITKWFALLLADTGAQQEGRGFYSLRHTFATVAGGCLDQVAVNHVMGHADASMPGVYREAIADERLVKVSEHVRRWLYPAKTTSKGSTATSQTKQPKQRKAAKVERREPVVSDDRPMLRVVG
jgi:integrase